MGFAVLTDATAGSIIGQSSVKLLDRHKLINKWKNIWKPSSKHLIKQQLLLCVYRNIWKIIKNIEIVHLLYPVCAFSLYCTCGLFWILSLPCSWSACNLITFVFIYPQLDIVTRTIKYVKGLMVDTWPLIYEKTKNKVASTHDLGGRLLIFRGKL